MTDEKNGIWNGGKTNETKEKAIQEWNRLLRQSEDFYDVVDSEREFRKDLVEREKMMKEQEEKNPIRSKFGDYNRREQINKNMDKPAPISGGDPKNRYRSPEGDKVMINGVNDDSNEQIL